jgi:hypothetical protein
MVFHDPFYNRKAKARTLFPRRHIGLGQTVPIAGRQANAIILNLKGWCAIDQDQARNDPAL